MDSSTNRTKFASETHDDKDPESPSCVSQHQSSRSSSFLTSPVLCFLSILAGLGWLPTTRAKDGAPLRSIMSSMDLDPISLITLFFDEPEKELLDKSGDHTLLSALGLFVNPSTLWNEYKLLLPGQGLDYYNPGVNIRSTIECNQVNAFIAILGSKHRNEGLVVDLYPLPQPRWRSLWIPKNPSWEWWLVRPLMLFALIVIAGISKDFWGIGAICALLLGQFVAIAKSIWDGRIAPDIIEKEARSVVETEITEQTNKKTVIQHNVFFLQNNVTLIVRCKGDLFRQGTSHLKSRTQDPGVWKIMTTITFLAGVLFVGFTKLNFKIAYLSAHALQASLIAVARRQAVERSVIVNRTVWEQTMYKKGKTPELKRRKDAYVWVCKVLRLQNTDWLKQWDLAVGRTLEEVKEMLDETPANKYTIPPRADADKDKQIRIC